MKVVKFGDVFVVVVFIVIAVYISDWTCKIVSDPSGIFCVNVSKKKDSFSFF